jgi:hypothetical protein
LKLTHAGEPRKERSARRAAFGHLGAIGLHEHNDCQQRRKFIDYTSSDHHTGNDTRMKTPIAEDEIRDDDVVFWERLLGDWLL